MIADCRTISMCPSNPRVASSDYVGASNVGIRPLLVRRLGSEGEGENKEPGEDLVGVSVIRSLSEVVDQVLGSRSETAQSSQVSS